MRIVITGKRGQIVSAIAERGFGKAEIITLGRPEFDLKQKEGVVQTLMMASPDIIVNAAAYTMVDKAEEDADSAMLINAEGAANVAEAAARMGVPLIHISTDYVFDGRLNRPYREDDMPAPTCIYGLSKRLGEKLVAVRTDDHVILRTAWVYSPYGANFVKTMLRLGESRSEVSVVSDQYGNPTSALDIADAVLAIVGRLIRDKSRELRGIFHLTSPTSASWATFAEAIFAEAEKYGRSPVTVHAISTAEYPTIAKRPLNSRLNTALLYKCYGLSLPDWRTSLSDCVARLLTHAEGM